MQENKFSKNLKLIKSLTWEEVFDIWRENETYDNKWEELYKSRGFDNWDEWRSTYIEPLNLKNEEWGLYEIIDPMQTVPKFFGGPFRSWVERFYKNKMTQTFQELVQNPEIQNYPGIRRVMGGFPQETSLIGIFFANELVIAEGMHRCTALALAVHEGKKIKTNIKIALANSSLDQLRIVGQNSK